MVAFFASAANATNLYKKSLHIIMLCWPCTHPLTVMEVFFIEPPHNINMHSIKLKVHGEESNAQLNLNHESSKMLFLAVKDWLSSLSAEHKHWTCATIVVAVMCTHATQARCIPYMYKAPSDIDFLFCLLIIIACFILNQH